MKKRQKGFSTHVSRSSFLIKNDFLWRIVDRDKSDGLWVAKAVIRYKIDVTESSRSQS